MLVEETEEGAEGMCPVIRSETLHSKSTDDFIASEADRCHLRQGPGHAGRGDTEGEEGMSPVIR